MKLLLNSKSKCKLELHGTSVELTAEELSGLRDCLSDTGKEPKDALPGDLFKRLFETGILTLAEIHNATDVAYWKQRLPSLCLSPNLKLDLQFSSVNAGMHTTEPAIGMFLEPEFVEEASRLQFEIQKVLAGAAHASAVRGTPFPRTRALALAQKAAHHWLMKRPKLSRWIEWRMRNGGLLSLKVFDYAKLVNASPPHSWSAGIQISLRTGQGHRAKEVLVPLEALPMVSELMDLLRDGAESDYEPVLSSNHVRRVLGAIEGVGGFIERDKTPPVFGTPASDEEVMAITHMGHAALIVNAGGKRVLIDPWLFSWDTAYEKQPLVSSQLGEVEAIFFTHHHNDHLNASSLLMLPHDVPVFVPCLTGSPLEPKTAEFLRTVGFRDVREMAHGESINLGNGLIVEAVPFFGEGQNQLGFGANCYLVSRFGRNVLAHADASPDSEGRSIVSTGTLQELVGRRGSIDVVFGTWWQERKFLCELSPLAVFLPNIQPGDWLKETEMCDCQPEFICELVEVSGATLMMTYAESGQECFLPRPMMSSYVPTISFLWQSLEQVQREVRSRTGVEVVEAQPYLTVVLPEKGSPYTNYSMVGDSRRLSKVD